MVTSAGLDKAPSSCLAHRLRRQNQYTITCPALNQGYLIIHISVWSSLQTVPPVWKRIIHWWITPMFTETSLIRSNRLALLHCHHIPDRRPVYPCLDFVTGLCGNSQNRCSRNMMQWAAAKTYEISLWSTTHNVCFLKLTNILATVSWSIPKLRTLANE